MSVETPVEAALFREVLGHFPTGVVIVTGVHPDGELLALVVGSFTSVSLDPPLVAFLPMKSARTFSRLQECSSMCINVLTGDQESTCRTIAGRWENKFDGIDWKPSPSGDPILEGSLAWMDVRLDRTVEGGDHWIALCEVVDLGVLHDAAPLIFFQGGYGRFVVPSLVARMGLVTSPSYKRAVSGAVHLRDELSRLAEELGGDCTLLASLEADELISVASAVAPGVDVHAGLGEVMPAVPPIGDTTIFAAEPEVQERWLARAVGADEEELAIYRERLDFCKTHGYLINFLPEGLADAYDVLHHAAAEYAAEGLTPARDRAVRQSMRCSQIDYRIRELQDDAVYDVGSIVVPVRDAGGQWRFTLRCAQLPRRVTGAQVQSWVRRQQACARRIEARLEEAGSSSVGHEVAEPATA